MKYRPDIDGLRAVAVMAVVLHHLSSRFVPGGYVGVDVFFVISGYLITKIISREIADGTFTFTRFYERRVRRIFPVLFAVLAAVLISGYFLLLPTDYLATFRGALGTVLFSANIVFWRDLMDGYFAADAKLNPLLHMWSLGVEEQFYVVLPLLLLVCFKYLKGQVLAVLLLATAISLLAAQFMLTDKSVAVFFLLPFRAWELLAGAILAILAVPQLRARWSREALAVAGLMAILVPVFAYDPGTAFPAMAAVPPVLGTVLLIHVGAGGSTWVGHLLQLRPVVYVGLISYSLYLWHWPLIVFTRFWTGFEPLRPWIPALRVINRGFEGRFTPSVVAVDRARTAPIPFKACESRIGGHPDGLCVIGASSKQPDVLLWGDSHMLAWLPAFEEALRHSDRAALVAPNSACPPLLGIVNGADAACRDQNLAVLATLKTKPQIRTIVMTGFWSKYFADSNISVFSRWQRWKRRSGTASAAEHVDDLGVAR